MTTKNRRGTKFIDTLKRKLFWGDILSIMMEAYLEFLISGWLNWKVPLSTTNGEVAANYIGYFSLITTCFILPSIFIWMLAKPLGTYSDKHFEHKWGTFYEGIKTNSKTTMFHYLLFMLRRMTFVGIGFSLEVPVL